MSESSSNLEAPRPPAAACEFWDKITVSITLLGLIIVGCMTLHALPWRSVAARVFAIGVATYHAFRGFLIERHAHRTKPENHLQGWERRIVWYVFSPAVNFFFTLAGFVALRVEWPFLELTMRYPSELARLDAGTGILHMFLLSVSLLGITGVLPELTYRWTKRASSECPSGGADGQQA